MRGWFVVLLLGCARPALPLPGLEPLELERAVPVAGPGDFQPSGLVFRAGRLYTVSDKDSRTLLEIVVEEEAAEARPAIAVQPPEGARTDLDLEGIAVRGEDFLVVSELLDRVLAVPAEGGPARWLDDVAASARAAGLLATRGAGFEGIAVLGDRLILAAEREPRGLVVVDGRVDAWQMPRTIVPLPAGRSADFADLATDHGHLYGLVRNGDAVVELRPAGARFVEGRAWSYAAVAAAHRYVGERFGLGEGLAIDDEHLYVIFDNNGAVRAGTDGDRRPMLFVFRWRRRP